MTPDQVIIPPVSSEGGTNTPPSSGPTSTLKLNSPIKDTAPDSKDFGAYVNNQAQGGIIQKISMNAIEAIMGTTLFIIIGVVFLLLAKVNTWSDEKNIDYASTVQTYKDLINDIDLNTGYPGINEYRTLISSINSKNINDTISSTIPFIFKKDLLEEAVGRIVASILEKNGILQNINKDINKYGFIHPDIMSILEKNKEQIPIMVSLHTLETIKFGTALKIFSMLDTFLQQASLTIGMSKDELSSTMDAYTQRGEKDIASYLSTCYLNPYERLPECDQVNDFSNYFIYEDTTTQLDTNLFSKIFNLIDSKLEKSDISSLQIEFNRFDPNIKNIGFRVTVNTLAEDDNAFIARGIINPHIFIISTLVTLLKQSAFVIGDSISVDKLNIRQQNITVGNIQIPVNTSFMTFDLPLQNSSEREIFDFYNNF